jgi:nitrile hydratase
VADLLLHLENIHGRRGSRRTIGRERSRLDESKAYRRPSVKSALEQQRAFLAGRGAWHGARIVARAWVDPAFKQALLTKGREAVRELNIPPGKLGKLGVAENTPTLHNVVVCTLCSCYPHDLLGDPPW